MGRPRKEATHWHLIVSTGVVTRYTDKKELLERITKLDTAFAVIAGGEEMRVAPSLEPVNEPEPKPPRTPRKRKSADAPPPKQIKVTVEDEPETVQ